MNIRLLETFLAVHRYGSMAAAARRLHLSHGTVAHQMKTLEEFLGIAVVRRAGRNVHLTKAGYRLLEQTQHILARVEALPAIAKSDTLEGELYIAGGSTVVTHKMAQILTELHCRYPDIRINLSPGVSAEFYDQLEHNVIDAAIATQSNFTLSKCYSWQFLIQEPLYLLASARHHQYSSKELLTNKPLIHYQRGSWIRNATEDYLRQLNLHPQWQFELAATEVIVSMVHQDIGVAIVPSSWELWGRNLDVVSLPLHPSIPPRVLGVVWRKTSPKAQLIEAFCKCAAHVYGSTVLNPATSLLRSPTA